MTDRIQEWYDAVDAPAIIRKALDAAIRYHEVGADGHQCDYDRLLTKLVMALMENYAPNDSKSMWMWLEELMPSLTHRISSRNS